MYSNKKRTSLRFHPIRLFVQEQGQKCKKLPGGEEHHEVSLVLDVFLEGLFREACRGLSVIILGICGSD